MSKTIFIYGGNSKQSRLIGLWQKASSVFAEYGEKVETIFVHELPGNDLLAANPKSEAVQQAKQKVEQASTIVVFTPIYKASFSGILKTFLDLLPQKTFSEKIVLPIAIGGTFGHLLAIDYALKPVLAALGATTILSGVFVLDQDVKQEESGTYVLTEQADERLEQQVRLAQKTAQSVFITN